MEEKLKGRETLLSRAGGGGGGGVGGGGRGRGGGGGRERQEEGERLEEGRGEAEEKRRRGGGLFCRLVSYSIGLDQRAQSLKYLFEKIRLWMTYSYLGVSSLWLSFQW